MYYVDVFLQLLTALFDILDKVFLLYSSQKHEDESESWLHRQVRGVDLLFQSRIASKS